MKYNFEVYPTSKNMNYGQLSVFKYINSDNCLIGIIDDGYLMIATKASSVDDLIEKLNYFLENAFNTANGLHVGTTDKWECMFYSIPNYKKCTAKVFHNYGELAGNIMAPTMDDLMLKYCELVYKFKSQKRVDKLIG